MTLEKETSNQRKARRLREWRKANPDRAKELKKNWISKNREKYLSSSRNTALKIRYGITLEDYNRKFSAQNGKCAICNIQSDEGKKRLRVDHCHSSLKIRDLICQPCNTIVGMCFENIEILKSAIKYIEKHGSSNENK